jgi:hypothetical protein
MNKFWGYFLWMMLFFCLGLVPVVVLYAVLNKSLSQELAYSLSIFGLFVAGLFAHFGALKMVRNKIQNN